MNRLCGGLLVGLLALAASAQWVQPTNDVPAYYASVPHGGQPPILSGSQLSGPNFAHPYQVTAYRMAAKIPAVLDAQPCYCRCDREMGHHSLHSCFEGLHGAGCSTCMKEAVYAYRQTRLGRTPQQIRAGMERGEWMNVDLESASL